MIKTTVLTAILVLAVSLTSRSQSNTFELATRLYEEGLNLQTTNQHEEAIERFNKCVFLNARYVDAYLARAESRKVLKDFFGALTDLNVYLEFSPDQYDVLHSRAVLLFQLKRFKEAEADFKKLLRLAPGETTMVLYRKSAHSTGVDQVVTAQGNTLRPQIYSYLGLVAHESKDCWRAVGYLDSAIYFNPTEADFYLNRAVVKRACADSSYKTDYRKALILNPNHAIAKHNMAKDLDTKASDKEFLFTQAIISDSLMVNSWMERAYFRMEVGNLRGALHYYSMALSIDPAATDALLNRGFVKEKLSDLKGAYSDYTQAISIKEDMVKAWLNRGNVLMKLERYDDAVKDYTAAITYQPDYGAAYYNRAIALYRLERKDAACTDLLMAEKLKVNVDVKTKNLLCK